MKTYGFFVTFTPDGGGYVASVESLPGCISQGDDLVEAEEMIREAMTAYIESTLVHHEQIVSDQKDCEHEFPILVDGEVRKYITVEVNAQP